MYHRSCACTVINEHVQREPLQTNAHDCGPFACPDLVSLLTSDSPSTKTQSDMRAWSGYRRCMVARRRLLWTL